MTNVGTAHRVEPASQFVTVTAAPDHTPFPSANEIADSTRAFLRRIDAGAAGAVADAIDSALLEVHGIGARTSGVSDRPGTYRDSRIGQLERELKEQPLVTVTRGEREITIGYVEIRHGGVAENATYDEQRREIVLPRNAATDAIANGLDNLHLAAGRELSRMRQAHEAQLAREAGNPPIIQSPDGLTLNPIHLSAALGHDSVRHMRLLMTGTGAKETETALAQVGTPAPALVDAYKYVALQRPESATFAFQRIGELGTPSSNTFLERVVSDQRFSRDIRFAAADALARITYAGSSAHLGFGLESALNSTSRFEDPIGTEATIAGFTRHGAQKTDPTVVFPRLVETLERPGRVSRAVIVDALTEVAGPDSLGVLATLRGRFTDDRAATDAINTKVDAIYASAISSAGMLEAPLIRFGAWVDRRFKR